MQCPECSADSPDTARFCRNCGASMRGTTTVAVATAEPAPEVAEPVNGAVKEPVNGSVNGSVKEPVAEPVKEPVNGSAPAAKSASPPVPRPLSQTSPVQAKGLLPAFPVRLVWSPRKPWGLDTRLPPSELSAILERQLTDTPPLLRRFNSFHRNALWNVQRNKVSGQTVATCRATGPISLGFGSMKRYVDVTGDSILLDSSQRDPKARTRATLGVGRYTTYLGLYTFPPTHLTYDFVKTVKKLDASASVTYPWSPARMVVLALVVVWLFAAMVSGGGDSASAGTGPDSTLASSGSSGSSVEEETETGTDPIDDVIDEPADPEPAAPVSALPDESRAQMRSEIRDLLRTWHEDVVAGRSRAAWNLLTERKQSQHLEKYGYRGWARGQATLAPYLDPSGARVSIRETDDRTGVVTVDVTGMRWTRPGARCSTWSGVTWVRYENGEWRYDPGYSTTPQRERRWKDRYAELLGGTC